MCYHTSQLLFRKLVEKITRDSRIVPKYQFLLLFNIIFICWSSSLFIKFLLGILSSFSLRINFYIVFILDVFHSSVKILKTFATQQISYHQHALHIIVSLYMFIYTFQQHIPVSRNSYLNCTLNWFSKYLVQGQWDFDTGILVFVPKLWHPKK